MNRQGPLVLHNPGVLAPSTWCAISVAVSRADTPDAAVAEIVSQLDTRDTCFLLVLTPDRLGREPLAEALTRAFPGLPVFGATTAGQITPRGYETDALVAIAFPRAHFRCASLLIDPLQPLAIEALAARLRRLSEGFPRTAKWNRFALVLADGLSMQEDILVATMTAALDDLPVFGGSAGDALRFADTAVLHGGAFRRDAALVLLIETDMEFAGLGFDHFQPTDRHMVVTAAVPEERTVMELNGAPAASEYARQLGIAVEDLTPEVFSENPVLCMNNAVYHVRAIQRAREDGALTFMSAIDDGLPLTLGRCSDVLGTLEAELSIRDDQGRPPDFVLGFDCVLRKLEIAQKGLVQEVSDILRRHRVIGFNTYGEQHLGVHVNQTFVGVALFRPSWNTLH